MVYKPVEIDGRDYVDGGLVSTTNRDVAVETWREVHRRCQSARAEHQRPSSVPRPTAAVRRRVSDMGFPQIGYQAFQTASPISVCTSSLGSGRIATPASTSSSSSQSRQTS